jgi:hypothetical protein
MNTKLKKSGLGWKLPNKSKTLTSETVLAEAQVETKTSYLKFRLVQVATSTDRKPVTYSWVTGIASGDYIDDKREFDQYGAAWDDFTSQVSERSEKSSKRAKGEQRKSLVGIQSRWT